MLLLIDIGNTATNIAVHGYGGGFRAASFPTRRQDTADGYAVTIKNAFALREINKAGIGGAVIASVVPSATAAMAEAVRLVCHVAPLIIGPGVKTGLNIKLDDPGQLGADLAATAVGAAALHPLPCLVYDLGTATKITALARDGRFLGGAIYPGVHVSLNALGDAAALLPHIGLDEPAAAIGRNTVDAMRAGVIYGTAGALDGMADRMEAELGEACSHVATGGLAAGIIPHCRRKIAYEPYLIFEGMRVIYEKNNR